MYCNCSYFPAQALQGIEIQQLKSSGKIKKTPTGFGSICNKIH